MASVHRRPKSPYWHAAYYLPDGRRALRSTGNTNKKKAMSIALEWEKASRLGKEHRLTEQKAREAIAAIYAVANQDLMPTSSVAEYLARWLKVKEIETKESTCAEYEKAAERLKASLGMKSMHPMDAITVKDALRFRDGIAGILSASTANKYLKIGRVIWNDAIRDSIVSDNPFSKVKILEARQGSRKAFTLEQVKKLLAVASLSWRGMILLGFYTGQRIGDLARLTWQNIDLIKQEITLVTQKTGRNMTIPMSKPLAKYFMTIPAPDDPVAPLFPDLSELKTETLSGHFSAIVASIGLGSYDTKKKRTGMGHGAKRTTGNMSFHCLRHSATSALKNAGVSDVIAREIIGHDSEAVSRMYTHIETDTLRAAVERLPDITKE